MRAYAANWDLDLLIRNLMGFGQHAYNSFGCLRSRSRSRSPVTSPPGNKVVGGSPKKRSPSRSRSLSRSCSPAVKTDRGRSAEPIDQD